MWHVHKKDIDPKSDKVTPIFLHHGFLDVGSTWFLTEKSKNLIHNLMDTGKHDMWIINSRETARGKDQLEISDTKPNYWNFTFYEMATEDLP